MVRSGRSTPDDAPDARDLDELRQQIDAVDESLLEALNERARLVRQVGRLKQESGAPVYEPQRERAIVERLAHASPGPFPEAGLAPVFREIISATRSLEEPVKVAFLGPEGTFCHLAARRNFGELSRLEPATTIADVFAAVERGRAHLGVVPVENTTEGIVTATYDGFAEHQVGISGEILLRVTQHLLSLSGELDQIRRVASHPQALAQCRGWLDRNLPGIERVETPSTVTAARLAAQDGAVAAIGSAIAGEVAGLRTAEAAIQDRNDNTTRFVLLSLEASSAPSGKDLTSVVFTLRQDEPGALHRLLESFSRCGVNLSSIQLRPMKDKPWEYLFFLDLEGHQSEPRVAEALIDASAAALSHTVLGSFARARPEPR